MQYLYSIALDANVETIAKLRTVRSILQRAFPVVNKYELDKKQPMEQVRAIEKQIDSIVQLGKQEAQADQMKQLQETRAKILDETISTFANAEVSLELDEKEIGFLLNEMNEVLEQAKRLKTSDEMAYFDNLYSALENAA